MHTLPHLLTHALTRNQIKEETNELIHLDSKVARNLHLLSKMLELEEPTITAKMVDFLLQDGVCEQLLSYITQVGKCL